MKRWVAAFESKDLDRVLAFYTNDVIFHSPLIARLSHEPSGTVQGKRDAACVREERLRGVRPHQVHRARRAARRRQHCDRYKGITGTHVIEVLFFDKDGVVRESYVHYASA